MALTRDDLLKEIKPMVMNWIAAGGTVGPFAPANCHFVTTQAEGSLSAESVLTAGTLITVATATVGLSVGTVQYQYPVTGADPFTPAWSTGYLNITAAKTLTVSDSTTLANASITLANTGSLTLPAAATTITGGGTLALGGFTGTVPATATFAMGAGTLTSATANDVTGAAHTHAITASTALVAPGTAQYQALTTGANPYPAGWSSYYLDGTAGGKTVLAVTNTKTLTLTATDSYNLTIPATGTAALTSNKLSIFAATTSAELAGVISDETGSGALMFGTSPTITTSLIMSDGATIGQAAGPLVAFDDTNNHLEITGCNVGIGTTSPGAKLDVAISDTTAYSPTALTYAATGSDIVIRNDNASANFAAIKFSTRSTGASIGRLAFLNDGAQGDFAFMIREGTGSYTTELMRLTKAGRVGIGTTAPATLIHATLTDATTNAVVNAFTLGKNVTGAGVGANGLGVGQLFTLETSTTVDTSAARIRAYAVDATHATRKFGMVLSAYDTAERDAITIAASGTAAQLGFLGAAAVAQQAATVGLEAVLSNFGLRVAGAATLTNDLTFVGAGTGLPYGACYGNEIAWTQASAAQNTWYLISDADMVDGPLNSMTHDGSGKLTATNAGTYLIGAAITFECSAANIHCEIGISIDGAAPATHQCLEFKFASSERAAPLTRIITLTAAQTIECAVRTTDVGTPDITVHDVSITTVMLGG